jgi:hypothetical protein
VNHFNRNNAPLHMILELQVDILRNAEGPLVHLVTLKAGLVLSQPLHRIGSEEPGVGIALQSFSDATGRSHHCPP